MEQRLRLVSLWALGVAVAIGGVLSVLLWMLRTGGPIAPVAMAYALGGGVATALCLLPVQLVWRRWTLDLITEAARLREISTTDALTGGFNRRQVEKIVAAEMSRASRHDRALSLVMFDLDSFKAVNDSAGHAAGDEVLREVWRCASRVVREIDTVARWGGDEFLLVLPETNAAEAHAIAMRLQDEVQIQLRRRFGVHTPAARVTLSIGITTCLVCGALPVEALVSRADARLYEAKRAGRNRISW